MKRELDYFLVERSIGFNQERLPNLTMRMGGCGAVTACDCCIFIKKHYGISILYNGDTSNITKKEYISFTNIMKPYLRPRINGIDTLDIYIDGFSRYLSDVKDSAVALSGFSGNEDIEEAKRIIKRQIDSNMIIPTLTLNNKNSIMRDYRWHWYNIAGYDESDNDFRVKAISYGYYKWLDLELIWNTGYVKKGGLIIIDTKL